MVRDNRESLPDVIKELNPHLLYEFNEANRGEPVKDSSGANRHGKATSSTTLYQQPGLPHYGGYCLKGRGGSVADSLSEVLLSLSSLTNLSVASIVLPDTDKQLAPIWDIAPNTSPYYPLLTLDVQRSGTDYKFEIWQQYSRNTGGWGNRTITVTYTSGDVNQPLHVVTSFNLRTGEVTLYIDGSVVHVESPPSNYSSSGLTSNVFSVGGSYRYIPSATPSSFSGFIDEVGVFDKYFSEEDAFKLYEFFTSVPLKDHITGTVTLKGQPAQLPVKAFRLDQPSFATSTESDEQGNYTLEFTQERGRIYSFSHVDHGRRYFPSISLEISDRVRPVKESGFVYECTKAGILPDSEPDWSEIEGDEFEVGTAELKVCILHPPEVHGPIWVEPVEDPDEPDNCPDCGNDPCDCDDELPGKRWTVNFDGDNYGTFPVWTPSGDFAVRGVLRAKYLNNSINYVLDGSVSRIAYGYESNGSVWVSSVNSASPEKLELNDTTPFEILGSHTMARISYIGRGSQSSTRCWQGQIQELSLEALKNPQRARVYELTVISKEQPTTSVVRNLLDPSGATDAEIHSPNNSARWVEVIDDEPDNCPDCGNDPCDCDDELPPEPDKRLYAMHLGG